MIPAAGRAGDPVEQGPHHEGLPVKGCGTGSPDYFNGYPLVRYLDKGRPLWRIYLCSDIKKILFKKNPTGASGFFS
jgi:hypothetical protein